MDKVRKKEIYIYDNTHFDLTLDNGYIEAHSELDDEGIKTLLDVIKNVFIKYMKVEGTHIEL